MFNFENYQCAILGPSSSDSVANIEKKFGKAIFWVCMNCLKNISRKSGILIKTRLILPTFWLFKKKKKFSVLKQKLLIQNSHIKYSISF